MSNLWPQARLRGIAKEVNHRSVALLLLLAGFRFVDEMQQEDVLGISSKNISSMSNHPTLTTRTNSKYHPSFTGIKSCPSKDEAAATPFPPIADRNSRPCNSLLLHCSRRFPYFLSPPCSSCGRRPLNRGQSNWICPQRGST